MRLLASTVLILSSVASVSAQSGPVGVKFRFDIHEPGSFGLKTTKELGTKEAAAMATAVCAAFGVDCSQVAGGAAALIKTLVVSDKPADEAHYGIIRAPVGYEICKAQIDIAHASVDGESSFSAEIIRDPGDNGLGFYAVVPKFRGEGHSVEADLYLLFVPGGTLDQYGCWPKSDHSTPAHLWYCNHGCGAGSIIKPEARYSGG